MSAWADVWKVIEPDDGDPTCERCGDDVDSHEHPPHPLCNRCRVAALQAELCCPDELSAARAGCRCRGGAAAELRRIRG